MNVNLSNIVSLLSHRNWHKLAGTALAAFGVSSGNWKDLTAGAAYAAVMHLVGGMKKVVDGA